MKAVIIAAGQGQRIRSLSGELPKTLLTIRQKPILEMLLEHCLTSGIKDILVVTGYQHGVIEKHIETLGKRFPVRCVFNPRWRGSNGLSVLTTKDYFRPGDVFILSMSDHLYHHTLLEKVVSTPLEPYVARVALDYRLNEIFDIDDGMKVATDPNHREKLVAMSKTLLDYDAIDCGVFKCGYAFFTALEKAQQKGDCSLADACRILIEKGQMGGVDIGETFWLDLDTPEAWDYLQSRTNLLFQE